MIAWPVAIQPYTHCVLRDVFERAALTRARDEIINNIQATYKETDLFKVGHKDHRSSC